MLSKIFFQKRDVATRIGLYICYGTQETIAVSLSIGTFLATGLSVIATFAIGFWLAAGFLFFPDYFIQTGISGLQITAFFAFFAASFGLFRAVNYLLAPKPPGHFLRPVPPSLQAILTEEQILVRAASREDSALLRPAIALMRDSESGQLLRAVNPESIE